MAKTRRYFELDAEDGYFLADDAMLQAAGLTEPDALQAAFDGQGRLITVTLHPATQRLQQQIVRESTCVQEDGSLREDVLKTPGVRASVLIARWEETVFQAAGTSLQTREVDADFFGTLHPIFANKLDGALVAHLYPNVLNNPAFTTALQKKSKPSETAAK